jgi:AcrR family transcriptional regulator
MGHTLTLKHMFETGVASPEIPLDGTRERLLEAAGEVFAQKGFRDATIREICSRAGANIAAINYHFGGKERLYSEVLHYVDSVTSERHPERPPGLESMAPEDQLAWFIRQFMNRLFDSGRPSWHERLINREMVEPTFALDELIDRNIRPRSAVLQRIIRAFLGSNATDPQVQRAQASIVGQCLFYWNCRPVITRVLPQVGVGPDCIDSIAAHVTAFSLHGLRGLRAEMDAKENPA